MPSWFYSESLYRNQVLNPIRVPGSEELVCNILMWESSLNRVTWTLGIELRCSLMLPLLYWWSRSWALWRKTLLLMVLMGAALLSKIAPALGFTDLGPGLAIIDTAGVPFLFLFYLGSLLSEAGPIFFSRLSKNKITQWLVMTAAVALFLGADRIGDPHRFLEGAAAWLLMGSLLYSPETSLHRCLDHTLARFFGRISYSFYLWHDLVLIVIARCFFHFVPEEIRAPFGIACGAALLFLSISLTSVVAIISFRFIELPFTNYSRQLVARICPLPISTKNPPPPPPDLGCSRRAC